MVGSIVVCTSAPVDRLVTFPARTASEIVMHADAPQLTTGRPAHWPTPSYAPNKNVRSLNRPQPADPPNWFCRSAFFLRPLALVKKLAASSLSLRRKSKPLPWNALVPDRVMALMTPPELTPCSAE